MQDEVQPKPELQLSSSPPQPPRGPAIATGSCDGGDDIWDPVAKEKYWREELQIMRHGADVIEQKFGFNTTGFYVVVVGALDAATHFVEPEYFVSREAFLEELRRLMVEPTTPSRPVPSIEEYLHSQKRWLERIVTEYDAVG